MQAVWLDLSKFRYFDSFRKYLAIIYRDFIVFCQINQFRQIFNAIREIFIAMHGQLLNKYSMHLVTLYARAHCPRPVHFHNIYATGDGHGGHVHHDWCDALGPPPRRRLPHLLGVRLQDPDGVLRIPEIGFRWRGRYAKFPDQLSVGADHLAADFEAGNSSRSRGQRGQGKDTFGDQFCK